MKIERNISKEEWNNFVIKHKGSFLQSFEWGKFKESEGGEVTRISITLEGRTLLQAQAIKEKASFLGFYFHIPYGPVYDKNITQKEKKLAEKELFFELKKRNPIFVLVEPFDREFYGKKAPFRIEPQKTVIIDLNKSESEIFNSFKRDKRYSIRTAERKGVVVKSRDYDERFFNLLRKTKERHGFSSYEKSYFPGIIKELNGLFFSAEYNNCLIAGAVVVFFGKKSTYLHAASDYEYSKFRAPSLLQLHICLEAKRNGLSEHDLWGIDERKFPGVTDFKKGFSGKEIEYPQGKVKIFSPRYYLYILGKKIKNLL